MLFYMFLLLCLIQLHWKFLIHFVYVYRGLTLYSYMYKYVASKMAPPECSQHMWPIYF